MPAVLSAVLAGLRKSVNMDVVFMAKTSQLLPASADIIRLRSLPDIVEQGLRRQRPASISQC